MVSLSSTSYFSYSSSSNSQSIYSLYDIFPVSKIYDGFHRMQDKDQTAKLPYKAIHKKMPTYFSRFILIISLLEFSTFFIIHIHIISIFAHRQ